MMRTKSGSVTDRNSNESLNVTESYNQQMDHVSVSCNDMDMEDFSALTDLGIDLFGENLDSNCLSEYLVSGDSRSGCDKVSTSASSPINYFSISSDDELSSSNSSVGPTDVKPNQPIIVVTKTPKTLVCKGNSNSKQAIAARERRQQNKKYLEGLQATVTKLSKQNEELLKMNNKQSRQISCLESEVTYLKSVICNQSTLSGILKNIQSSNGVKLIASFSSNNILSKEEDINLASEDNCTMLKKTTKRKQDKDENNTIKRRKVANETNCSFFKSSTTDFGASGDTDTIIVDEDSIIDVETDTENNAGICLHVMNDSVSVELCAACNGSAALSFSKDHAYVKYKNQ